MSNKTSVESLGSVHLLTKGISMNVSEIILAVLPFAAIVWTGLKFLKIGMRAKRSEDGDLRRAHHMTGSMAQAAMGMVTTGIGLDESGAFQGMTSAKDSMTPQGRLPDAVVRKL
jgi:hypothetical protein